MQQKKGAIGTIPYILWGEPSPRLYLYIHGKCGCKEEAAGFAEIACAAGWQVLSIDLPGHGARTAEAARFVPWEVVPELKRVYTFAAAHWDTLSLRANSIGAWFSMLALPDNAFRKCLFVSPIVDMVTLIRQMMQWAGVSEARLRAEKVIATDFGETLSAQYYDYALSHPLDWTAPIAVLYAGGDNLTDRATVDAFVGHFACSLTVMPDGEHWFHTPAQLQVLRDWTEKNL